MARPWRCSCLLVGAVPCSVLMLGDPGSMRAHCGAHRRSGGAAAGRSFCAAGAVQRPDLALLQLSGAGPAFT
jgi:hypothetical protein